MYFRVNYPFRFKNLISVAENYQPLIYYSIWLDICILKSLMNMNPKNTCAAYFIVKGTTVLYQ